MPKNDCEVCSFDFDNEKIDYKEAMDIYRLACLETFDNPQRDYEKDYIYVDIDDINVSYTADGKQNITFRLNETFK